VTQGWSNGTVFSFVDSCTGTSYVERTCSGNNEQDVIGICQCRAGVCGTQTQVSGSVRTTSGTPIAGASVTTNLTGSTVYTTNSTGQYAIADLYISSAQAINITAVRNESYFGNSSTSTLAPGVAATRDFTLSFTPYYDGVVRACGYTATLPRTYVLSSDLNCSDGNLGIAFDSTAAGAVLDCQNRLLTRRPASVYSTGVYVSANNAVVRNCRISGFQVGIQVYPSSTGTSITDNTITLTPPAWTVLYGIFSQGPSASILRNTLTYSGTAGDNAYIGGISVYGASSTVSSNTLTNLGRGIDMGSLYGTGITVSSNTLSQVYAAITDTSGSNCFINNNVISSYSYAGSTQPGISLGGNANNVQVSGNTLSSPLCGNCYAIYCSGATTSGSNACGGRQSNCAATCS
jgi:hypothetical protein